MSSIIPQCNGQLVEKEGCTEIQKIEYLENKKSFLDEIKSIFHSFWKTVIWWKNKNLMKIVDTSFNSSKQKEQIVGSAWTVICLFLDELVFTLLRVWGSEFGIPNWYTIFKIAQDTALIISSIISGDIKSYDNFSQQVLISSISGDGMYPSKI